MNNDEYKKFRIEITTKQHVPVHPKNPYLKYIQDDTRKGTRLSVKVFYDDIEIGHGVILDFYKQFEIIEDFGASYTNTSRSTILDDRIYKLKYFKNPPISEQRKQLFISGFVESFIPYVEQLKNRTKEEECNCFLTYMASSTQTPDLTAKELSDVTGVDLANIISKNDADSQESKNIEEYFESMEHAQRKYLFDTEFISAHTDAQYIIIDDVMGLGSSILTTLKAIYDITGKMNYFLIVVKDVKR